MNVTVLNVLVVGLLALLGIRISDAQTKYACVTSSGGDSGEYSSSSEELFDSSLGNHVTDLLAGHLTCIDRPQTLILVTKFIYGFGGFSKCAAPDNACDVEEYSDPIVTPLCDGQPHCMFTLPAKHLPKCGTLSNFVHVEYECVHSWSLYNICKDTSSTVKGAEIFIASPNFFNNAVPPSRTCECIVRGRYDDQIMLQYAHTDILDDGNGQCKGNFFLIESKLMPNQTEVDKRTQVCGKRTTNNELYRGTIRVTYTISTARKTDGFLSKIIVPPNGPGGVNEMAVECGPVRSGPGSEPPPEPVQGPPPTNNQGPNTNFYQPPGFFAPNMPPQFGPFQNSHRIPPPPVFKGQGNQGGPPNQMGGSNFRPNVNNTSNGTGQGDWNRGQGQNQIANGGFDPRMNRPDQRNWQWGPPNPYAPQGTIQNNGPIRNLDLFSNRPQPSLPGPFPGPIPGPFPGPLPGPFGPWNNMNRPPTGPGVWNSNSQGGNNWQNQGSNGRQGNNPNNRNWGGPGPGQNTQQNGPPQGGPNNNNNNNNNGGQPPSQTNPGSPRGVEFIGKMARKEKPKRQGPPSPPEVKPAPPPPPAGPGGAAPVVSVKRQHTEQEANTSGGTGRNVAYIVGGIGAVLTAGCALFITLYCTKRNRQRKMTKPKETSTRKSSGHNDVPVYTLPSAFEYAHPSARSCVARINSAYVDSESSSIGRLSQLSGSFESINMTNEVENHYHSVSEVQINVHTEPLKSRDESTNQSESDETETVEQHGRCCNDERVYDNNIK